MIQNDDLLARATEIAITAHEGQTRKNGEPYANHPLRVSEACHTLAEKVVGMLHDVVEDTGVTLEDLKNTGFPEDIVDGVESVTKRDGESYLDFVLRSKANPIGRTVKAEDIRDNTTDVPDLRTRRGERHQKYLLALHILKGGRR